MNDFERFQTIVNQSPQDTEAWLKRLWTLWTLDQYYVKTEGGRWHKRWKKKETINRRKPEAVRKLPEAVNFLSDTCPIIALPCPSLDLSFRLLKTWMTCPLLCCWRYQIGLPGSFAPLATFVDYDKGIDDMLSNNMMLACFQRLTALIAWLFRHFSFSNNVQLHEHY